MGVILKQLGVKTTNFGSSFGNKWFETTDDNIDSNNPSNNSLIASVTVTTPDIYDDIISSATDMALKWRNVPAPCRADTIRDLGLLLRENKAKR